MSTINFTAKLFTIGSWTLLTLPAGASAKLPSRGMTMVRGTINGFRFTAPLEPDGRGSHWLRVDKPMREGALVNAGDTVTLEIEVVKEWPEPEVPTDLKSALAASRPVNDEWMDITPAARWDWIRWIGASKSPETRRLRIGKVCSMLEAGKRRPCCFNRNQCTAPDVSKNGVLIDPGEMAD